MIKWCPRVNGNTKLALTELSKSLNEEGIDTEIIEIGSLDIKGCKACRSCFRLGKCVIDDIVNEVARKLYDADGLIVGTPTYCASPNGNLISFLDRLFFSNWILGMSMKVSAAVAVARRAGTDTCLDVINKYFTLSNMVVVGSHYWNDLFGNLEGEVVKDEEGMQNIKHLGKNMAFLIKCIKDGKTKYKINYRERTKMTNYIR